MEVYFTQVERILKELPIGYYLGHRIPAHLDEGENSYIDMIEKNIVISFPMIKKAMEYVDDPAYETTCIRSLLYHEVSHAIMTPKSLFSYVHSKEEKDIVNVMEDQRIEESLRYYFKDINFQKNIEIINDWKNISKQPLRDAFDAFYRTVRFNVGKKEWLDMKNRILKYFCYRNASELYCWSFVDYTLDLYNLISKDFECMSEKEKNSFAESDDLDGEENGDSESNSFSLGEESEISNEEMMIPSDVNHKSNSEILSRIEDMIEREFSKVDPSEMLKDLIPIITSFNKKNSGGAAIAAHSGVINPRRVGRPDYRIFDRKAQEKGANKFCSVHLNLFLDCSGSFYENQGKTNSLIAALAQIEKMDKNFTFDIVYCGVGEKLVTSKADRMMNAQGGNRLDNEIWDLYRKVQKTNTYNYNIVLFDGDAFTDVYDGNRTSYYRNFGAFNHPNCTIISDYNNMSYINQYAAGAKKVFTRNYVQELQKNVIDAMRFAFR